MPILYAQAGTEGGNITNATINVTIDTPFWAGIVGTLNGTTTGTLGPVSFQNVSNATIYTNNPNGTYVDYFNATMIVTRLPFKPSILNMSKPERSDFNESGMFSTFTAFLLMSNYSQYMDSPLNTFCNPSCSYMNCTLEETTLECAYVILNPNTRMAVLKFSNGTTVEPLFLNVIVNALGYNGSNFDFEYMVPAKEFYYMYIFKKKECNITVWIDDVQTTTFPNTGVPYKTEFLVTDNSSTPVANATVRAVEVNGRNIFYPIIQLGLQIMGFGTMTTNSSGRAVYALTPTRYNIPDNFGYETYVEAESGAFYCRQNLSIASYGSLTPTYRTSLVDAAYGSQVKASVQNMNALASTASRWITSKKNRYANITAYTNGSVYTNGTVPGLPTLKAGAPNLINITAIDNNTATIINATADVAEGNGFIIFVPSQPNKNFYNNTFSYNTNGTLLVIPTRYNNNANITIILKNGNTPFATLVFPVDSVLENPAAGETNMTDTTYSQMASALQNINSVLANIAKSISTV
jgi:hypothetical protein